MNSKYEYIGAALPRYDGEGRISGKTLYAGAHGMTVLESVTFDVNTGRIYRLEDLFKENVDYVTPLSDIIKRQIRERNIPLIVDFTSIKPNQDFYIENRTLMIYFQLYELAPYVYGFVTFPIPTREIDDIIREGSPLSIL